MTDGPTQKTVVAIYTGAALVDPGRRAMAELLPDVKSVSILDDSLISEVIAAGTMTSGVLQRMYSYCRSAEDIGASVILETCSSIGESVSKLQPFFSIPIVRIDEAMIDEALNIGSRIGVLATLPTTLEPTKRLIISMACNRDLDVEVVDGLAIGAFEQLTNGYHAAHDDLVLKAAEQMRTTCDVIVLAQGSMARMEGELSQTSGLPVLSSLHRGIAVLRKHLV